MYGCNVWRNLVCFDWVIQLCVKIFKVGIFNKISDFNYFNFYLKVYEETVTSSSQVQAVQGTFTLDAPLGSNVRVVAHCADEADLDTVEVVSPNGRVYDLPLVSDGMLHIRIPQTDEVRSFDQQNDLPRQERFIGRR